MTSRSRFCDLSAGSAFETKASPYSTWSGRGRSSPERRSPPSGLADRGRLYHLAPASPCRWRNVISRAASLHGRYSASPLLPAPPPPSRLRPTSRGHRLYGLPGSVAFAAGRGGLLQLLDVPWSPCRRSHPAGASRRVSRCDGSCCLRPTVGGSASGASHFRGHHCVHLRYGPVTRRPSRGWPCRWASGQSVSLLPAIQATGVPLFPRRD